MIRELQELLDNESASELFVQKLCEMDMLALMQRINYSTCEEALKRGVEVVRAVIAAARRNGIYFETIEPGHSVGHMVRDYVNALRLFSKIDASPADIFVGFVAGVLHDIGCAIINRYDEANRVLRHAEAAAALLGFLFEQDSMGLTYEEKEAITYAVAAHTHYLKPQAVRLCDGSSAMVVPYPDLDPVKGEPIWAVWFPRWVDRLDCSGSTFFARHYLTLVRPHVDFTHGAFCDVDYQNAMRRLLRDKPEGSRTMLEHMKMFADSQTNESVYGMYDLPWMQELRAAQRRRLYRIIDEANATGQSQSMVGTSDVITVRWAWMHFLRWNVEPCEQTAIVAMKLDQLFGQLSAEDQLWWANTFLAAMKEYDEWSKGMMFFLGTLPTDWMCLPGLVEFVPNLIGSHPSWRECGVLNLLS